MGLTWADRVAHWNQTFQKFPPIVYSHGWVYGVWYAGKGFTKNVLHGQYPPTFLRRALALWPDVPERRFLHLCAGSVQHGVRVDLAPRFRPSVRANVEVLPFLANSFDAILYDPPYDVENAQIYGVAPRPPRWGVTMNEAVRVLTMGGHLGILHWYYPSYSRRKQGLKLVALIPVVTGFCSPTRVFSIFEKIAVVDPPVVAEIEAPIALPWSKRTKVPKVVRRRGGPAVPVPEEIIEWG